MALRRPRSLAEGSNAQSTAPSLTTVLRNIRDDDEEDDIVGLPSRPQALWNVTDHQLPVFNEFWPSPVHYVIIQDEAPAVIAVRIAEALRKRSVLAEYDNDTCSGTAETMDGCRISLHLYQYQNSSVLVEVMRIKGSVHTFQHLQTSILFAAQGLGNGADTRPPQQSTILDLNRLLVDDDTSLLPPSETPNDFPGRPSAVETLEHCYTLLGKDRLDAQHAGLESLVALTDTYASNRAPEVCQFLLESDNTIITKIRHEFVLGYYQHDLPQRRLALRVLRNIVVTLQEVSLPKAVLDHLEQDLLGAQRPLSAETSSNVYDAILVCEIFHVVAPQSTDNLLKVARIGHAISDALYAAARRAYHKWTEVDRSC